MTPFFDPQQTYEKPTLALGFTVWVDIDADAEQLFRYLTRGHLLERWWTNKAETEAQPGGRLYFEWQGEAPMSGQARFRVFEPFHTLAIEWTHANGEKLSLDGNDPRGMVWLPMNVYTLHPLSRERTRLTLQDVGIRYGKSYAGLIHASAKGWLSSLEKLKRTVEKGKKPLMTGMATEGSSLTERPTLSGDLTL
jgi:uncharacterized protein YndB with AHSA1/START domain